MVFSAIIICAVVGFAGGLLTGAYESKNEAPVSQN